MKDFTIFFLLSIILINSCKGSSLELKPLKIINLPYIEEPSGISIDKQGNLLVVDDGGKVCRLKKDGRKIGCSSIEGDLEGISAFDKNHNVYWVIKEGIKNKISGLEPENLTERPGLIDLKVKGLSSKKNSGLEGICITSRGKIFAVNEKKPGLFLQLKLNKKNKTFEIIESIKLDFARDYSGIWADEKPGYFWILSHKSKKLYLWNKERRKTIISYKLPIKKAEGIAIDFRERRIYIVCDKKAKLYIFPLPHFGKSYN